MIISTAISTIITCQVLPTTNRRHYTLKVQKSTYKSKIVYNVGSENQKTSYMFETQPMSMIQYFITNMKTAHVFGITLIFITLIFAFASANFDPSKVTTHNLSAASLSMQIVPPTPLAQDASEVGSTDGIVIMGVIIVIIVTVPVLFRRKRKERK